MEVNLAINDQHQQYSGINDLVAKLSIHVRMAGDVEIVIPLGWNATLDNDDLIILNKHEDGLLAHGGKKTDHVVTYEVGGQPVTLTFTFDEDYITITTDGINDAVFDYCKETYGDGINFEAYLYLNEETSLNRESFKAILDQATIEFIDEVYPDYYINAFTDSKDVDNKSIDCTVSIVDEQKDSYTKGQNPGHHLNGSNKNEIYKKEGVENENANNEHNHKFLWGE